MNKGFQAYGSRKLECSLLLALVLVAFGGTHGEGAEAPSGHLALEAVMVGCEPARVGETLTINIILKNGGEEPVLVLQNLRPESAGILVTIKDASGRQYYESPRAKARLKLNYTDSRNYVDLAPDEFIGRTIEIEKTSSVYGAEVAFPAGEYYLAVDYHNRRFHGTAERKAFTGRLRSEILRFNVVPESSSGGSERPS